MMRPAFEMGRLGIVEVIVWLVVVIAIVILVVAAIRWLWVSGRPGGQMGGSPTPPAPRPDDPLEILRQRYARGEIDEEEYERRRRTLGG